MRLPTFWQLDLRIDRMWKRPWGNISLFFDIQNITNHRNVEFRESNLSSPTQETPTLPLCIDMMTFEVYPSCRISGSSWSRGDRWAAVAIALALGGCMRIYPDPELPDVLVEWSVEFECSEDTERVVVSLSAIDPAAEVGMVTVPCGDAGVRFDDVAPQRYRLAIRLEDPHRRRVRGPRRGDRSPRRAQRAS